MTRYTLLLHTAGPTVELTLVPASGGDPVTHTWQADRQMAQGLLGFIRQCLAAQADDPTLDDATIFGMIAGLGVMRGPGSFTSLRIGAATANSLSYGLGVPVVGAVGEEWQEQCLERLAAGQNDHVIVPEYGRPARITAPRK